MRALVPAVARPVLAVLLIVGLAAFGVIGAVPAADAPSASSPRPAERVTLHDVVRARSAKAPTATTVPERPASEMIWPVTGEVTSEFGTRWGKLHGGIDVAAPTGTAIVAARTGTVVYSGWQRGYGQVVEIDHGDGTVTAYAHQSVVEVAPGQPVERGDRIGAVGSTGRSTAPHLHFEIRRNGGFEDPRQHLPGQA